MGREKVFQQQMMLQNCNLSASRKKAMTAVGFGLPTGVNWYAFTKDDSILFHGVQQFNDFILLVGGAPIYEEGAIIGDIGISGGHYKQDEACYLAAMKVLIGN